MTNVVSQSSRNPRARSVLVNRPEPAEASFIPALMKGLGVSLRHFFRNVNAKKDTETLQYPEETIVYPERFRGLHRLMQREDGTARCVACMCCPTVCPANCITIVAAESDDPEVEKYPAVFEIDTLRCVVCGLCVEACPCDAIRMDTGLHAMPVEFRGDAVHTKEMLLSRGIESTSQQGGRGAQWRDEHSGRSERLARAKRD